MRVECIGISSPSEPCTRDECEGRGPHFHMDLEFEIDPSDQADMERAVSRTMGRLAQQELACVREILSEAEERAEYERLMGRPRRKLRRHDGPIPLVNRRPQH